MFNSYTNVFGSLFYAHSLKRAAEQQQKGFSRLTFRSDVCKVFKVEDIKIFSKWINPIQTATFTIIQPALKVMAVLFVMNPLL